MPISETLNQIAANNPTLANVDLNNEGLIDVLFV